MFVLVSLGMFSTPTFYAHNGRVGCVTKLWHMSTAFLAIVRFHNNQKIVSGFLIFAVLSVRVFGVVPKICRVEVLSLYCKIHHDPS